MDLYQSNIPKYIYSKLNKDSKLSRKFRSSNVGKCTQLFDNYYHSVSGDITKSGWSEFYLKGIHIGILDEIVNYIVEEHSCSEDYAKDYVYFRVVGQTWNGMAKEQHLIEILSREFLNVDFIKTNYELDEQYFTDWEAYSNDKLLFGIQIKPISYKKMNTPYQLQAKENHKAQANAYREKYEVPHIVIYYDGDDFYDRDYVFNQINTILAMKINVIT
jgi:hypothetical protein